MGNIFKMVANAIMRRFVGWGVKSGMDYFNGGGKSQSSYTQDGQQPVPEDAAARRARHAANKARRSGR